MLQQLNLLSKNFHHFIAHNLLIPLGLSPSPVFSKKVITDKVVATIIDKLNSLELTGNLWLATARKRMYILIAINSLFLLLALVLQHNQRLLLLSASLLLWGLILYMVYRLVITVFTLLKNKKSENSRYVRLFINNKGFLPNRSKQAARVVFNQYYYTKINKRLKFSHRILAKDGKLPTKTEIFNYCYYYAKIYAHKFWRNSILYFIILLVSYTVGIIIYRIIIFNNLYSINFFHFLNYPFSLLRL